MRSEFAHLVGSRICHDLISPLGAISNGVELIELTQGTDGAEMALINDSVENANARIGFFRVAFGEASPDQFMGRTEILKVLAASARGGRLNYYWKVEEQQRRVDVRVAFLVLLCFESALPRGGDIVVDEKGGSWSLIASGAQLRWDDALWDSLTNEFAMVDHTPAGVQFALLPEALADAGKRIEINRIDSQITVTIR